MCSKVSYVTFSRPQILPDTVDLSNRSTDLLDRCDNSTGILFDSIRAQMSYPRWPTSLFYSVDVSVRSYIVFGNIHSLLLHQRQWCKTDKRENGKDIEDIAHLEWSF